MFVFWISIGIKNAWIGRKIAEIGKTSEDIYVIHMMLIKFLIYIPSFISDFSSLSSVLYYSLYSLLITILISLVTRKLLHKIKFYRLIMGKF
jgi:hypothetical protein